ISNNIIVSFLNSTLFFFIGENNFILELTPLNPVIHVGEDLELTCRVNDCPDNVTFVWKAALDTFLGGEVKNEQNVSRLLIRNISVKHSDTVVSFPEDPILPKIKSLIANQEQKLICTVHNIYPLDKFQIEWLRGDKTLREEETDEPILDHVKNYSSVFNYTPSVDDLGKNISCKATLKLNLIDRERTTTAECKLLGNALQLLLKEYSGLDTRTITVSSNNTSVKLGERLEITCHADGNPKPTIFWWKLGETEPELQSQNNKLIINNASWSQAGWYRCNVSNDMGSQQMRVKLTVVGPPNIPKIQLSHREEPKEGESIRIFCSSDGGPAELKLYRQSQSIATGDPNKSTVLLNISSIQITDSGIYTCEAKNDFGIERSTINITVQGEFITFWRSCLANVIAWGTCIRGDYRIFIYQ
uniref:Vascular cell adhesion molecule 1a n=1 Tax=Sinocyclocheilus anshuiensis TaxID=1608454 RepID=A0A671P1N3_9TELE